jgi:hypothetical protein
MGSGFVPIPAAASKKSLTIVLIPDALVRLSMRSRAPQNIENMIFTGDSRFRAPHESPFEHLTASPSAKSLSNVCVMNSLFLWRCFVTSRSDACYFAMARRVVAEQHVFGKIAAELVSDLCFCVHDCLWNLPRNSLTLRVLKDNHCESSTNRERTCGIGRKHIGTWRR